MYSVERPTRFWVLYFLRRAVLLNSYFRLPDTQEGDAGGGGRRRGGGAHHRLPRHGGGSNLQPGVVLPLGHLPLRPVRPSTRRPRLRRRLTIPDSHLHALGRRCRLGCGAVRPRAAAARARRLPRALSNGLHRVQLVGLVGLPRPAL
jgi:hypothetical protein